MQIISDLVGLNNFRGEKEMSFFTEQAAEFLRALSKSRNQSVVEIDFVFLVRFDLAVLFPSEVQGIPVKIVFETAEPIDIAFNADSINNCITGYKLFKELRFTWAPIIEAEARRVFDGG